MIRLFDLSIEMFLSHIVLYIYVHIFIIGEYMIVLVRYSFMLAFILLIQRSYDYWRFKYTSDREKCALDCFHLNKHNERGDLLTYILIVIVKFIETQSQILRFQHGLHFPIRQKANHYCISICSENIIVVVWEKFSTRHP